MDIYYFLQRKWDFLKELIQILHIPYQATIRLQRTDLTLSDVYVIWMEMILHLQHLTKRRCRTSLGKKMIDKLQARQNVIFHNSAMICNVFLDPRIRSEIVKHGKIATIDEAKTKLKELWRRIQMIKNSDVAKEPSYTVHENSNVESSFDSFDASRQMRQYFGNTSVSENIGATRSNDNQSESVSIDSALDHFNPDWLSFDQSVLGFWEKSKESHRELYQLALAVYAIPPTEVQIERDFSKLENILTKRRMCLSHELLEAILLIHLNPDIFYFIKEEEI